MFEAWEFGGDEVVRGMREVIEEDTLNWMEVHEDEIKEGAWKNIGGVAAGERGRRNFACLEDLGGDGVEQSHWK